MPALIPTSHSARIEWLGVVPDRDASLRSAPRETLVIGWDGPEGEAHSGRTRPSDSRVTSQHSKGTEIANVRQLTILCGSDLDAIAAEMGAESVDPIHLGATMVIRGIPDFTHVPPSSRLQAEDGTTLVVDMENRPCLWPAKEIDRETPGLGAAFKPAAAGRRGVTAWTERPGTLRLGGTLVLHVPDQPVWPHLAAVRGGG